jgi:hypothetical protein
VFATRDAYWSRFLEIGTKDRRRKKFSGKVEPRPFLTRALADNTDMIERRLGAAIEKTLRDAVR